MFYILRAKRQKTKVIDGAQALITLWFINKICPKTLKLMWLLVRLSVFNVRADTRCCHSQ